MGLSHARPPQEREPPRPTSVVFELVRSQAAAGAAGIAAKHAEPADRIERSETRLGRDVEAHAALTEPRISKRTMRWQKVTAYRAVVRWRRAGSLGVMEGYEPPCVARLEVVSSAPAVRPCRTARTCSTCAKVAQ